MRTHRPQSSPFGGLPYRILYMNPTKELLLGPMRSAIRGPSRALQWCFRVTTRVVLLRVLQGCFTASGLKFWVGA